MTDLEIALQSPESMDSYLEIRTGKTIIDDIKNYANKERVIIATAAMQGLLAGDPKRLSDELTEQSVRYADSLIKALNKQS